MSSIVERLQRVTWDHLSAIAACGPGLLYASSMTADDIQADVVRDDGTIDDQFVLTLLGAHQFSASRGGKHGSLVNADEGWAWCISAVAPIALRHGGTFGGSVSSFALLGSMIRMVQRLYVVGQFLKGFALFEEPKGVAETYAHAYPKSSGCIASEDGGLEAIVAGLVWLVGLEQASVWVDADMARWCDAAAIEVAETEWAIFQDCGGRPQFWSTILDRGIPARRHEVGSVEIRATIASAQVMMFMWALHGGVEWLNRAETILHEVDSMLELTPWAVWVERYTHPSLLHRWIPVGANGPGSPRRVLLDRGPKFDDNRLPGYAVLPPGTRTGQNENLLALAWSRLRAARNMKP